jgi:hypothetical protein
VLSYTFPLYDVKVLPLVFRICSSQDCNPIHYVYFEEGKNMRNKIRLSLIILSFTAFLSGCNGLVNRCKGNPSIQRGSGSFIIEQRELDSFIRISIAMSGNITMKQGENEAIRIETNHNLMRYILTEVRNGTLFIHFSTEVTNFQPSSPNRIVLEFKELKGLETSGSSNVKLDNLVGDEMEIKLGGSGDIEIDTIDADCLLIDLSGSGSIFLNDVQTDSLGIALGGSGDVQIGKSVTAEIDAEILGSGDVNLAGKTKKQKINIPGSGDYDAVDLRSEISVIEMVATGRVIVWAEEYLSIRIYPGKGTVAFYGNPTLELAAVDLKEVTRIRNQ